ncbi:uncharacterized protein LOC114531868 [Dendronephthya gigantea]|uniref:uncharacterized protein LOC114531868 n=1 Tax=Dendronephthya gigantea TaxID=151771 RepID=UPI00106A7847|nr:uncharacterized protein LOC114531868 [Dendronephthya gigantea]
MCPTCDDTVHSDKPLHDRQEWLNGFYHYLKPTESVSREGIIMVKERYCPLICDTQCRSCGEGQLRKCVAKDKIILVTMKALEDISAVKGRTGIINASTFRKAAAEWRYCQYEVDKLQGITYIDCPPCSMSQHSAHVDGNQKLYRFKSVPRGNRTSYYGDLFIKNNTDVDIQIAEVYSTGKKEVGSNACGDSHWKAAKAVSKSKKKQDETGLEVACCRHSIAQAAVNMFRGEIYGYAHYLHTQYLLPRHVKFLWQDVICLYWPWAVSNTPRRLLKALDMAPALSVMHGKSHSWNCQFTWGGRWQDGAANGTGEEAEQVNSYISRLGSTTKRMSAAGREEALTEHVLGWNKRKVLNMPKYLRMRYAKTAKTLKEKQKELEETLVDFGLQGKEEKEILEWKSTVENFARADGKIEQEYGDAENYFILYHQIRDATLLKSFVEGGDRQTRDLLGNVELHSTVESKTSQLCSLQQQLSKIK